MSTSQRKAEHLRICLEEPVGFPHKTTGFEAYDFAPCALPELDYDAVDVSTTFLGVRLTMPFMVTAMTGGHSETETINAQLAELCQAEGLALGLGSQRQALEAGTEAESYRIARQRMPKGIIVGNIGGAQIARMADLSPVQKLVDLVEANALAVHLNPLQELLQPEGDRDFRGVLDAIGRLVHTLSVPIIVKEVGCGISGDVTRRLVEVGVKIVDVAGAGGTSWAAIETRRGADPCLSQAFADWGLPTAQALVQVRNIPNLTVIASGGIDSGLVLAKALALGASLGGAALPVLKAVAVGGVQEGQRLICGWREQLRAVLYLTGCPDLAALHVGDVLILNPRGPSV